MTLERLTSWMKDAKAHEHYIEAFKQSDFEAMVNYYRQNHPDEPYKDGIAVNGDVER